jgi:hypothetical protein
VRRDARQDADAVSSAQENDTGLASFVR